MNIHDDVPVALVTGANKGIGYQIALGLCAKGCTVLLGCRDEERAERAVNSLRERGFQTSALILDVTRPETLAVAAAEIDAQYGKLDILVNNAGISAEQRAKPSKVDLDLVRRVFETNVFGVIATTQAMLPLLLRSSQGRIVNLSSSLGSLTLTSDPDGPWSKFVLLGYNSSKAALNGVTVQFANELRETPIKVNSVCPGYVATDLNGNTGYRSPEEGANVAIQMATLPQDGPTGGFFNDEGRIAW
jgi:NAD(P)-dependent dehydrogenase (short-subunit alcohol dehydrogenase family)